IEIVLCTHVLTMSFNFWSRRNMSDIVNHIGQQLCKYLCSYRKDLVIIGKTRFIFIINIGMSSRGDIGNQYINISTSPLTTLSFIDKISTVNINDTIFLIILYILSTKYLKLSG